MSSIFDFDDCRKYNFTYLNQFLPLTFSEIKKLRTELENFNQESNNYKLSEKISYLDNLNKVKHYDIILGIGKIGQTGVTLRAIEAII